jgi:hypothetical protein
MAAAYAWDGTDTGTGAAVQIEQGNTVRTGNDIQLYDEDAGEYHDVTVEHINRLGSSVEVDVYDSDTGENRTLQFDDNDQ